MGKRRSIPPLSAETKALIALLREFDAKARELLKTDGVNYVRQAARRLLAAVSNNDQHLNHRLMDLRDALVPMDLWDKFKATGIITTERLAEWEQGFHRLYMEAIDDHQRTKLLEHAPGDGPARLVPFFHPQGGAARFSAWEDGTDMRPFVWNLSPPTVHRALEAYLGEAAMARWREAKERQLAHYQSRLLVARRPQFAADVLELIVQRLPMASAGRLAAVCVWMRGHIHSDHLRAAQERTRFGHTVDARGLTLRSANEAELTLLPIHGVDLLRITHASTVYIAEAAPLTLVGPLAMFVRRIIAARDRPAVCTRMWFVEGAPPGDGYPETPNLRYFRVELDCRVPLPCGDNARFRLRCVPVALLA